MKPFLLLSSLLFAAPAWAQSQVKVRVLDPKNAPVAGASVQIEFWRNPTKLIAPKNTDASGAATFQIPALEKGKSDSGGVSVVAKGFAFNNAALKGKDVEIHLQPGATWRGKVVDESGKPIAGAKVRVTGAILGQDWKTMRSLRGEKNSAPYETKTGADGSFFIADVPAKMKLMFGIEHPDYALKNGNDAVPDVLANFKLAPGASVRGRILDLAGKPLAGVLIYASAIPFGEGGNDGKTDKNGVFTIRSLGTGLYNIGVQHEFRGKEADFVFAGLKGFHVEAGKAFEVPDFRAVKAALIRGTVRDADTKKPVAGAGINADGGGLTTGYDSSDAQGRFGMRVLPGQYKVYISGAPEGYTRPEIRKTVVASETKTADSTKNEDDVIFEIRKTTILRGTIVDEAGKPLRAKVKLDYDTNIQSDANGKWQYAPQSETKFQPAGGDDKDGYFEVVSPLTIEANAKGPIIIVLRKKSWQELPGRALSLDGTPLEGVEIEGKFYSEIGDTGSLSQSIRTAKSNANGDFVLPQIRDGIRANFFEIKGKKAGYAFQKGGEVSKNGPVLGMADLVFAPLNGKIEGVTTPDARVTVAGIETLADKEGKFAFEELPATANQVFAWKDGQFGTAKAHAPLQIELKAQGVQARDENLAREIWGEVVRDANASEKGKTYYRLNDLTRRLDTGEKTFENQLKGLNDDYAIAGVSAKWANKVDLPTLEAALAKIKDSETRLYAYLTITLKTGDKLLAARALQQAETLFATPPADGVWWREWNLYRAAVVAAKFGGEQAGFMALDRAVAFTLKNHGTKSTRKGGMPDQTGRDEIFALASEIVAEGGPQMLNRLRENIDPDAGYDVMALGNAIPVLAKNNGAESVLPLFDELEKMPEPKNRGESSRADQIPQYAFAQAAIKVVPMLGEKSPQLALELARRVREDNNLYDNRAKALAGAAKFQNSTEAAKLWREILAASNAESAPRFAARAFELDEKLGRELFEIARQKVEAASKNEWQGRQVWAGFAFYFARADAAEARFILEREWGQATQKKTEGNDLGALAFAMSAIDAPRAAQMAREIPLDDRFSGLEAGRRIGIYLTASEEKRRDYPFGNRYSEEQREAEAE